MKKTFYIFLILFIIFPFLTFAESACPDDGSTTLCSIIDEFGNIATLIIILLMVVATVVFIYGVLKYILAGGSEQRKKEGQSMIMWGLIGLFILVAMWGLVIILENTFGVEEEHIPRLPGQIDF